MTSIRQWTTRQWLTPLGHSYQLSRRPLKRSSRCYAQLGQVIIRNRRFLRLIVANNWAPTRYSRPNKRPLYPAIRRPPWSSHRSYSKDSYADSAPQSIWARIKPAIVVEGVIGLCDIFYCQWAPEKLERWGIPPLTDSPFPKTILRPSVRHDPIFSPTVQRNLVNSAENIQEGRWWVMITSSFAHANLTHLAVNMAVLWGFGGNFIALFGIPCFVGLWVFSAPACSAAQLYWQRTQERLRREIVWSNPEDPTILGIRISRERARAIGGSTGVHIGGSVGASGAISGLMGVFWCYMPMMPVRQFFIFPMPLWLAQVLFTFGSLFCMIARYLPLIGHAGHLGGTAAGIAYYYGAMRPSLRCNGKF